MYPGCLFAPGDFPWDKLPRRGGIRQRTARMRSKGKIPELEQGARIGAGRQNWSRATVCGEEGLQEMAILPTS